jgi:hypothetical protein
MGLSRSAVKSLLFRAREEFRQVYLSIYGHPPGAEPDCDHGEMKHKREDEA